MPHKDSNKSDMKVKVVTGLAKKKSNTKKKKTSTKRTMK